jgi:hypothetical protein
MPLVLVKQNYLLFKSNPVLQTFPQYITHETFICSRQLRKNAVSVYVVCMYDFHTFLENRSRRLCQNPYDNILKHVIC